LRVEGGSLTSHHDAQTRWLAVWACFGSGVVVAFQVGKAAAALPTLEVELRLTVFGGAAVLSMIKLVGAVSGSFTGGLTGRLGPRRVAISSLVLVAVASTAGAGAVEGWSLIATRVAEGAGSLGVFVSVPSLLVSATHPRHRNAVFGLWGAHVPVGMTVSLMIAPVVLDGWGWRPLWVLNGVLLAIAALVLDIATRGAPVELRRATSRSSEVLGDIRQVLATPRVRHVSVCFLCYTAQWSPVVGFLPTIYTEQRFSTQAAGLLTAAVVALNAVGNLAAGAVMRIGVPRWTVLAVTSATMGACSVGIFAPGAEFWLAYALALTFSLVGGLLPATILASVHIVAESREHVPAVNGVVAQGSNLGAFLGPLALGALAALSGNWNYSPVLLVGLAGLGVAASLGLRREQRRLDQFTQRAFDVAS
jgi:MFS family permease